jgi:Concanavalin A-like lectin/glucanases superfamily
MKCFSRIFALVYIFAAATVFAGAPVRNGLVLYFPTVGTPVRDTSNSKNNATASSLMVSNSPSLVSMQQTHQLTYCAWINPSSIAAYFPDLISKGGNSPGPAYGGYEITLNVSADHDLVFEGGDFGAYTGGGLINNHLGEWIHVAFTIDTAAQTVQFYVNGQPVDTSVERGAFTDVNFDLPANLYVGCPDPAAHPNRCSFDGQMRQVMLFKRALSADEIQTIFSKTTPTPGRKR